MIHVKSLVTCIQSEEKAKLLAGVEEIFFESSTRKEFSCVDERAAFKFKYLGWYAEHHPEAFFIAHEKKEGVLGYICGAADSLESSELCALHPWFSLFQEQFTQFPAHLHINCTSSARGLGIGSMLLSVFENHLRQKEIPGVHLVTSPDARNVGFYEKNGYKFRVPAVCRGSPLLLMGKLL